MLQSLRTGLVAVLFISAFVIGNYVLWTTYSSDHVIPENTVSVLKVVHHYHGIKEVEDISNKLALLAKEVAIAKRYSRSQVTQQHLINAFVVLEDVMEHFNGTSKAHIKNDTVKAESGLVCPEEYKGTKFGYPFYSKGWEIVPCNAPPLRNVITILLNLKGESESSARKILKGIEHSYPLLPVHIALDEEIGNLRTFNLSIKTFLSKNLHPGKAWNNLLHSVKTPYLFVGRDLDNFDGEARLERQIRVSENLQSTVVGGAIRRVGGKWAIGCQQFVVLNYTLAYIEGYDVSRDSCLYCEYLSGPFVARTDAVQKESFYWFDEGISKDILFEDLFMRIKRNKQLPMICPDAMYFVKDTESKKAEKGAWLSLIKKWGLNRVRRHGGQEFSFTCSEAGLNCNGLMSNSYRGMALPICCLEACAAGMNALFELCDKKGFVCETDSGNLIGTVKMNGILPWDVDGDISYSYLNHSGFKSNAQFFKDRGMHLSEGYGPKNNGGGFFTLGVQGWTIEMWGMGKLTSEDDILMGRNATKMYAHGYYHRTTINPGRAARNRYGHEVYRHVPHWRHLGKSTSWLTYESGKFTPCPKPGHHACLDQFMGDGNIQFKGPWL